MSASLGEAVVVDTSAAAAVILAGPGSNELVERLEGAVARLRSAASRVELGIVIEFRLGPAGADAISQFLRDAELEIVEVDTDTAERALSA